MSELSKSDWRFCELADEWRDCYGWITYGCQHREFSSGEQAKFHILASSLLDEIRKRRPDLDVQAMAELCFLNFGNPPNPGKLELLVRDATDVIVEVYVELTTGERDKHIGLANPSLKKIADKQITSSPINPTKRRLEILQSLCSSKKRLSRPRLFRSMEAAGSDISENTLRIELSKMRHASWIDNDQSKKPCGFGITDKGHSILEKSWSEGL